MLVAVTRFLSVVLLTASITIACIGGCAGGSRAREPDADHGGDGNDKSHSGKASAKLYQDEGKGDDVASWRWKGSRRDCFFVLGNKCFGTLEDACKAARCKKDQECASEGGGPAAVSCR